MTATSIQTFFLQMSEIPWGTNSCCQAASGLSGSRNGLCAAGCMHHGRSRAVCCYLSQRRGGPTPEGLLLPRAHSLLLFPSFPCLQLQRRNVSNTLHRAGSKHSPPQPGTARARAAPPRCRDRYTRQSPSTVPPREPRSPQVWHPV